MAARRSPAGTPRRYLEDALSSTDPIESLEAIAALRERIDEAEHQAVFNLRHSGASWQEIADATGMKSRQAAQFRYEQSAGLVDKLDTARGRTVRA